MRKIIFSILLTSFINSASHAMNNNINDDDAIDVESSSGGDVYYDDSGSGDQEIFYNNRETYKNIKILNVIKRSIEVDYLNHDAAVARIFNNGLDSTILTIHALDGKVSNKFKNQGNIENISDNLIEENISQEYNNPYTGAHMSVFYQMSKSAQIDYKKYDRELVALFMKHLKVNMLTLKMLDKNIVNNVNVVIENNENIQNNQNKKRKNSCDIKKVNTQKKKVEPSIDYIGPIKAGIYNRLKKGEIKDNSLMFKNELLKECKNIVGQNAKASVLNTSINRLFGKHKKNITFDNLVNENNPSSYALNVIGENICNNYRLNFTWGYIGYTRDENKAQNLLGIQISSDKEEKSFGKFLLDNHKNQKGILEPIKPNHNYKTYVFFVFSIVSNDVDLKKNSTILKTSFRESLKNWLTKDAFEKLFPANNYELSFINNDNLTIQNNNNNYQNINTNNIFYINNYDGNATILNNHINFDKFKGYNHINNTNNNVSPLTFIDLNKSIDFSKTFSSENNNITTTNTDHKTDDKLVSSNHDIWLNPRPNPNANDNKTNSNKNSFEFLSNFNNFNNN